MSIFGRIAKCLSHPSKIIVFLGRQVFFRNIISDELYLKMLFKNTFNYRLNLKNPQTLNEKMQWLKVHERRPEYSKVVDKYLVREYVAELVGEQYLIPLLGVWDNVDEIVFDKLPKRFVLKCTHDSGSVFVVWDKKSVDLEDIKKKLNRALKQNYFYRGREWAYKNVKPRIIAEQYLEDEKMNDLIDYKLMVFNGKVKCSYTCTERSSSTGLKVTYFDMDWNKMPFERAHPVSEKPIEKPCNFDEMVRIAEVLAEPFTFARIDFYEVNTKLYVGEITLYPIGTFEPNKYDSILGEWLALPTVKK